MVIFANRATKDIYIANIMWVEQATDIMAIHYYMHEPRAGEPYSNKTKLSDRKNLAPEYFRKVHGKEMSVSTFSPKPSDEACAQDVKYKQFDIPIEVFPHFHSFSRSRHVAVCTSIFKTKQ